MVLVGKEFCGTSGMSISSINKLGCAPATSHHFKRMACQCTIDKALCNKLAADIDILNFLR